MKSNIQLEGKEYIHEDNLDKYLALDILARSKKVWFWPGRWYLQPYALELGHWDKFGAWAAKEYPVQHRTREFLTGLSISLKHHYKEFYWKIHDFFKPQNRSLIRVIPKNYCPVDVMMRDFLFACVSMFVEEGLEGEIVMSSMKGYTKYDRPFVVINNNFKRELKECYKFINEGRAALEKEISYQLDISSAKNEAQELHELSYKQYRNVDKVEKKLAALDDKWINWIVENRSKLDT